MNKSRSALKHEARIGDRGDVPTANWLVERSRAAKHVVHSRHLLGIPRSNVGVEKSGALEQSIHVGDQTRVPVCDRFVQRGAAVDTGRARARAGRSAVQAIGHGGLQSGQVGKRNGTSPRRRGTMKAVARIGRVLVPRDPRRRSREHVVCGGTAGANPSGDVLVKARRSREHGIEVCHGADDPGADVLVERRGTAEHVVHVCHQRRVPL